MQRISTIIALCSTLSMPLALAVQSAADTLPLSTLNLSLVRQDWGEAHADRSVDGHPLTIAGKVYSNGFGTHAKSSFTINLKRAAQKFTAMVGVDDETHGRGSVVFGIIVDGRVVARTRIMRGGDPAQSLSVRLIGAKRLTLAVSNTGAGIDFDHADWASASLTLVRGATAKPVAIASPLVAPRMTIPRTDPRPGVHKASIVETTPGRPFVS